MYNIAVAALFSLGAGPSLQPRSSRMIRASKWSIGTETMDRNLTIYNNYERFIEPLGEKYCNKLCLLFCAHLTVCVHLVP